MIQNRWFLFLSAWLAGGVFLFAPRGHSATNDDCLACHGQTDLGPAFVDEKAFSGSIHGKILCVSCHQDAKEIPHVPTLASVSCAGCHRIEAAIYLKSDHGRAMGVGRAEAATCKDCHGHSHTLLNSRDPQSPVNRKNIVATCAQCHADMNRMAGVRLTQRDPLGTYAATVHGQALAAGRSNAAVCSDCHGTHDIFGAANPASRVYRPNIPKTCERCHENVALTYRESVHGTAMAAGVKESPVCTDCHGEHSILSPQDPGSSTHVGAITQTCSTCHTSTKLALKLGLPINRLKTYKDSYHGMAAERGNLKVANCASCHGFHDILPSSDPRSSIHRANLPTTCGQCHTGAGPRLSTGYVHGLPTSKHWSLWVVKVFYLFVIPLTVGLMFMHNFLDWARKAWSGKRTPLGEEEKTVRLTVNERIQHGVLILTFFLLAYTGFATKFSEESWMHAIAPLSEVARRAIHRWAALGFCLLSVYHVGYMILSRRGRVLLTALLPRWSDVKLFVDRQLFNVGIRKTPAPSTTFYTYAEKIEYWALVWGALVMGVTGTLQVFNNVSLRFFPLWTMDLAMQVHFYEAVLACLAILVWHLYRS
ncbi:MAG: cytochrome b/b6 domain-containing protein [Elusimicrobia bacterium]|nr:cytochrome b/b6 domain-containing protein [Elusimicrobiota bacterium]